MYSRVIQEPTLCYLLVYDDNEDGTTYQGPTIPAYYLVSDLELMSYIKLWLC